MFFFSFLSPYLNGELHYRCILVVKKQHDPGETPLVLLDSSIMVGTERPPCRWSLLAKCDVCISRGWFFYMYPVEFQQGKEALTFTMVERKPGCFAKLFSVVRISCSDMVFFSYDRLAFADSNRGLFQFDQDEQQSTSSAAIRTSRG